MVQGADREQPHHAETKHQQRDPIDRPAIAENGEQDAADEGDERRCSVQEPPHGMGHLAETNPFLALHGRTR